MSLLDLLLIAIVGGSVVSGFLAGFARAGVGFAAAVTGILFGFWFYGIPAEWITAVGDLRTLPFHLPQPQQELSGLDGFYAARLSRRA